MIYQKLKSAMTIGRLYKLTGGSYYRFLDEAHALCRNGILKLLDQGKATPKSTHELPLSNLLLEQAAEEQMSKVRRDAIPFDVLERLIPVWVSEPEAETWPSMPEPERDLLSRIDGRLRVQELLSDDREIRSQQGEMLIVQLRKGAIALVPTPVEDLEAAADEQGTTERKRWWRPFWKKS